MFRVPKEAEEGYMMKIDDITEREARKIGDARRNFTSFCAASLCPTCGGMVVSLNLQTYVSSINETCIMTCANDHRWTKEFIIDIKVD